MSFVAVMLLLFFVFTQSAFHSKNGCFICKNKWQKDRPFLPVLPYKDSFAAVFGIKTASQEISSDAEPCRKCYMSIRKWKRTGEISLQKVRPILTLFITILQRIYYSKATLISVYPLRTQTFSKLLKLNETYLKELILKLNFY